jgi:serine/threonine protein kinase
MSSPVAGPFAIGERVGSSVWLADDTRNGKRVALKLLTRQLPKDTAKRDALIREVRVAAALYHSFLVPVLEIVPEGDNLLMIMEAVDAQPVFRKVVGNPFDRTEFFRVAYQLASVVKYLHTKSILHGNLAGDSVLVTPEGQVRLAGLNLGNLLRRRGATRAPSRTWRRSRSRTRRWTSAATSSPSASSSSRWPREGFRSTAPPPPTSPAPSSTRSRRRRARSTRPSIPR